MVTLRLCGAALALLAVALDPVAAADGSRKVSFAGVAGLTGQCQRLRSSDPDEDRCRSALAFQPTIAIRPAPKHEVFFKIGLAVGDGLDDVTPFSVAPWAADLHDSVTHVNGGSWRYLLNAWYRYEATFRENRSLALTVGVIDSTDYLDQNRYSNDEYRQFLNGALVNGPNAFLPSYSPGLALSWAGKRVSVTGVYMNVNRPDDDSFGFYGLQASFRATTGAGEGHYRVLVDATTPDFPAADSAREVRRAALLVSVDQELGEVVGLFLRLTRQSDEPAIDYTALYSGGVELRGHRWGRPGDHLGIGLALLPGGNAGVRSTRVAEVYYLAALNRHLDLTADLQYLTEDLRSRSGPRGLIGGLRLTVSF
ncbi:MAG: carbohydrate porin [Acidobacteriota bacterium]|jgi:porin